MCPFDFVRAKGAAVKTDSLVLLKPGKMDITRVKVPDPGPGEVLVEVKANGICRMDIALFTGKLDLGYPCHHGHEAVGVVAELGQGVKDLKVGDKVTCMGYPTYQRHVVVPASKTVKIPDAKADLTRWIVEPVACAVHGVQASNIRLGGSVALIGCGYMGLLVLQALPREVLGRLVVVDPDPSKLELAQAYGAKEVFPPEQTEELAAIGQKIGGFDVAIEASGAKGTLGLATSLLHQGGTLNIFGWHAGTEQAPTHEWHYKGLVVINPSPMMSPDFFPYMKAAVTLMSTGRIDQTELITHRFPFEEAGKALDTAANRADGYIKGVLCF